MMFSLFRIFRKIEALLFGKLSHCCLEMRLGMIPGTKNTYRLICRLRNSLYDRIYDKLKPRGVVLISILG